MTSESTNDTNSGGAPNDAPASDAGHVPPATDATLPAAASEIEMQAQEGFADDGDFAEHYRLLFASVALFVATMWLPIEGRHLDLYAKDSIAGGFLAVFAAYGICAAWMNIHNRKMIMWPMLFGALDGLFIVVRRGMQLVDQFQKSPESKDAQAHDWVHLGGPGLYVILFACFLVIWTLIGGVMKGAAKAKGRQEAAKANRAARKAA